MMAWSGDAKETKSRVCGCDLPRDEPGEPGRSNLPGRQGLRNVFGYAGRGVWPHGVADTRLCFDGEPLPPVAGDAGGEPGGGDEVAAGDVYPAFQCTT